MIKITAFHRLPLEEERIGQVLSIDNSYPRNIGQVHGRLKFLAPPRKVARAFRQRNTAGPLRITKPNGEVVIRHEPITQEAFIEAYRQHLEANWAQVSHWLESLDPRDELYLCTWTTDGFDHRQLVARLIQHYRPDIDVRVT
ncbi:MAG: hypothetical protein ACE5FN_12545 [Leptospirillia bacterium]